MSNCNEVVSNCKVNVGNCSRATVTFSSLPVGGVFTFHHIAYRKVTKTLYTYLTDPKGVDRYYSPPYVMTQPICREK